MLERFLQLLEACGEDVEVEFDTDTYYVDFWDFEGFDDHYREIMREYDHPKAVEALEDWLEEKCESSVGDFYKIYHFDGFDVRVGYMSDNI